MSELELLRDKKEAIIVDMFLTLEDNTVPSIVEASGFHEATVHNVINKYLNNKQINE